MRTDADSLRRRLVVLFVALAAGGAGCASHPISAYVPAGSTLAVAMPPGEVFGNELVAFGSRRLRGEGVYDDQRGELFFELVDGTTRHALDTNVVSAVHASRASALGRSDTRPQTLALIDIPATVPDDPDPYDLEVSVVRRTNASQTDPSEFAVIAGPVHLGQQVTVLPGEGELLPETDARFPTVSYAALADDVYPAPRVRIRLPVETAAAELTLDYRETKLEILDVFVLDRPETGVLVTWQDTGSVLEILVLRTGSTSSVLYLGVSFRLIDPFGAEPDFGRASPSDFVPIDPMVPYLFKDDGTPLSGSVSVLEIL